MSLNKTRIGSSKCIYDRFSRNERLQIQSKPTKLPSASRHNFLLNLPFNPKVSETNRKLKITRVAVDSKEK